MGWCEIEILEYEMHCELEHNIHYGSSAASGVGN